MSFDAMYMENILDHYKNPHNKGTLQDADIKNEEKNPSCGDQIEVTAKIKEVKGEKVVAELNFNGTGCAISQAAISMLTDELKGLSTKEVMKKTKEDVVELLGVDVAPMRIKCAMLGLRVLQRGILSLEGKDKEEITLSAM